MVGAAWWGIPGVPLAPELSDDQLVLWRSICVGLLVGPCLLHRPGGMSTEVEQQAGQVVVG